jgi:hypothetical protein
MEREGETSLVSELDTDNKSNSTLKYGPQIRSINTKDPRHRNVLEMQILALILDHAVVEGQHSVF